MDDWEPDDEALAAMIAEIKAMVTDLLVWEHLKYYNDFMQQAGGW